MPLFLMFLFLFKGGDPPVSPSPTPETPPTLSLTISFERQALRQDDCVNVVLLIANQSDVEVRNVSVEVASPSLFQWFDQRCEDDKPTGQQFAIPTRPSLNVGSIAARSSSKKEFLVHTNATVAVGEYNILFTVPYEWTTQRQNARSLVSAEKAVKVSFFGNDSIAGIPLALAGFIVPGLLFWLIVKKFGATWSLDALSDQMIYSVMVSIALVLIGSWIGYGDVSAGISVAKLTSLAAVGAGLGLIAGITDRAIRHRLSKEKAERQISRGESPLTLLGKILELPSANRLEKAVVTLKNGEEYSGSLAARTNIHLGGTEQEIVTLVPSYKIDWSLIKDSKTSERMSEHIAAGEWRRLIALADQQKAITMVRKIEIRKGTQYDPIAEPIKQWEAADVSATASGSKTWLEEPLDVKTAPTF